MKLRSSAGSAADGSIPCLLEEVPSTADSQELQVKSGSEISESLKSL